MSNADTPQDTYDTLAIQISNKLKKLTKVYDTARAGVGSDATLSIEAATRLADAMFELQRSMMCARSAEPAVLEEFLADAQRNDFDNSAKYRVQILVCKRVALGNYIALLSDGVNSAFANVPAAYGMSVAAAVFGVTVADVELTWTGGSIGFAVRFYQDVSQLVHDAAEMIGHPVFLESGGATNVAMPAAS